MFTSLKALTSCIFGRSPHLLHLRSRLDDRCDEHRIVAEVSLPQSARFLIHAVELLKPTFASTAAFAYPIATKATKRLVMAIEALWGGEKARRLSGRRVRLV